MKLSSRLLTASIALGALGLFTRCGMPGQVLGIYATNGTLTTNSCGAGLEAPSPWNFNVEMSRQTGTLYWNTMDGSPLLSGTMQGSAVTMTNASGGSVDETADGAPGPCTMERDDELALTIDDANAAAPSGFTGTLTYSFSVVAGANCADQLTANGGIYDTLPCTVSYGLTGSYLQAGQ
jgi:hypothetical protein